MGERYLHYAEQIVACGDEWMQEYDDIAHRQRGRLNIAVPIMMGSTLIEPMLALRCSAATKTVTTQAIWENATSTTPTRP